MPTKLVIVWDGEVPGLSDRRLSLTAFEPALRALLTTIKRLASDLEVKASPKEHARGRFAREAQNLDVQLVEIRGNSPVTLEMNIVPMRAPSHPLIADLADVAVDDFLRNLERESAGSFSHYQVRKFMHALPAGLALQRYVHTGADGTQRRDVKLGPVRVQDPRATPNLFEIEGTVVGFVFERGRSEVRLLTGGGRHVSLSATLKQVEEALPLRRQVATALGVTPVTMEGRSRLLRLVGGDEAFVVIHDKGRRTDHIVSQWGGLLKRLAE